MTDIVAIAMSAAWDRVKLHERQVAMTEQEHGAFAALAQQLRLPVDELRHRAVLRCSTRNVGDDDLSSTQRAQVLLQDRRCL
jgi:hypothetical protein